MQISPAFVLLLSASLSSPILMPGQIESDGWHIVWAPGEANACRLPDGQYVSVYEHLDGAQPESCDYDFSALRAIAGTFVTFLRQAACTRLTVPYAKYEFETVDLNRPGIVTLEDYFGPDALRAVVWPERAADGPCPAVAIGPSSTSFVVTDLRDGQAHVLIREPTARSVEPECGSYSEFALTVVPSAALLRQLERSHTQGLLLGASWFQGN